MANCKWNHDTCLEEARKYKSRGEFQKKCKGAYLAALRHGWLDDCDWFEAKKIWDKESCLEEARKYKSRGEFWKECKGAYEVARKNGWLDDYDWLEQKYFYKEDKLHLLESADLENMSNHQLIELISQDKLPREFKILIKSEGGSKERKNDIENLKE